MTNGLHASGIVATVAVFVWAPALALGADYPVAGVRPDQRPANAPVIDRVVKDQTWYDRALHGVERPVPGNIEQILKDQGNWYTPFSRPGMTGRYDIRRWHGPES